jgi:F1F0 ATPase subunit 2
VETAVTCLVFFVLGVGAGLLFFWTLDLTTRRLLAKGRGAYPLFVASFLLRLAAIGAFFYLAIQWGLGPIVAALVGVILGRTLLLRKVRRSPPGAGGTAAPTGTQGAGEPSGTREGGEPSGTRAAGETAMEATGRDGESPEKNDDMTEETT